MSTEPQNEDERSQQLWRLRKALGERVFDLYKEEMRKRDMPPYVPPSEQWSLLRTKLSRGIVADDALLDRLALLGIAHQHQGQRLLLAGPTGAGKTHCATKLAHALGIPYLIVSATDLLEVGWGGGGTHLSYLLEKWVLLHGDACATGIIVIDELDKTAPGKNVEGNSREKPVKLQASLLPLLGRSPVVAGEGKTLSTLGITVICAGAFSAADWSQEGRVPSSEDLIEYGLIPELVDRLEERLTLPAMDATRLVEVWTREIGSSYSTLDALACSLGYDLKIEEEVYAYVAQAVVAGRGGTGPRTARSLIEQAAKGVITEALRSKSPPGTQLKVTPDDVQMPKVSRPRRRSI